MQTFLKNWLCLFLRVLGTAFAVSLLAIGFWLLCLGDSAPIRILGVIVIVSWFVTLGALLETLK